MSKQALLKLANFNLFNNTNQQIEFSLAKDNRVMANFSGYDKAKGYDVRGIRAKSAATAEKPKGQGYIRLSIAIGVGEGKEFHNAALFSNKKKVEGSNQPDFQGTVNLDNQSNGPKLRLSAWKKEGPKSGDYLSISIQEFQNSQGPSHAQNSAAPAGGFDMDDDHHHAPQEHHAPAPQSAPAPVPIGAAAASGFDEMDDIPF